MKTVCLDEWTAQPHYPSTLFIGKNVETGVPLNGIFPPVRVRLPGSLYTALMREGIIPELTRDMNTLSAEWVKDREWLYECNFTVDEADLGRECYLEFASVDYRCHVYLNNAQIGVHEGASAPFGYYVGKFLKKGKNLLRVVVAKADGELGQIGRTSEVTALRHRFDYKWDFCPRLVNIGIYREVKLHFFDGARISGALFETLTVSPVKARATVFAECVKDGTYELEVELKKCGKRVFYGTSSVKLTRGENAIPVDICPESAELWYPNGMGGQPLYDMTARLTGGDESILEKKVGFREITVEKNDGAPEDSFPYTFVVNGRRVFVRGFDMTPIDFLLGNETEERCRDLLKAARDAHANIIRVWGGGIIESDAFYRIASEYGLMIWQDMIQSSSGIDNLPRSDENFIKGVLGALDYALKGRGCYPAFAVICGGNELFGEDGRPITSAHPNVRAIEERLEQIAPRLIFFPSTASGPTQEASLDDPSQNHDIHGPWLYLGSGEQFRHYNKLRCLFAGEFGCNGMSSAESLSKFLSPAHLKVTDMASDDVWRHHGEVWDPSRWVKELIGETDDLETYAEVSRFLQWVGLEYGVDSLRRGAFYESGLMIWQLNEMFPNVSSTALIDYYGNKKPAYFAAKKAFAPTVLSFEFDKMICAPNETVEVGVFVQTESPREIKAEITVEKDGETTREIYNVEAGETAKRVCTLEIKMPRKGHVVVRAKSGEYSAAALFATEGISGPAKSRLIENIKSLNAEKSNL